MVELYPTALMLVMLKVHDVMRAGEVCPRVCVLDELGEEASSAVDHSSSLRLLSLRASDGQSVIHVTFLMKNRLRDTNHNFNWRSTAQ